LQGNTPFVIKLVFKIGIIPLAIKSRSLPPAVPGTAGKISVIAPFTDFTPDSVKRIEIAVRSGGLLALDT